MCTCIAMKTQDVYFGRTMDIDYRFGEHVVVTPRNYHFPLKSGESFETWYAMVGMAAVSGGYPLYAEATNEKGLSIAGLNFPGSAHYAKPQPGKLNLAPYELIPWVMGNFASVPDLRGELKNLNLTDVPFDQDAGVAPLHWMISDGTECLVVEQTETGLHIYENPSGVLTNNPDFPYHQMNLNAYMNLSCQPPQNRFSQKLNLEAYGGGMGAIGLPGDSSPTSRYVRACFMKMNSLCGVDDQQSVSQFFHILDSVAVVKGSTRLKGNQCSLTTYWCCANASQGIYYYKTYENNQLTAVRLTEDNMNARELSNYALEEKQQVRYLN